MTLIDKVFHFRTCIITVKEDHISTVFREDESESKMHPCPDREPFQAGMREVGTEDPWFHAVQHELAHALLADAMGWPHSWSLWSSAHSKKYNPDMPWSDRVANEEHIVIALQRFANTGKADPWGILEHDLGTRVNSLATCLIGLTAKALSKP